MNSTYGRALIFVAVSLAPYMSYGGQTRSVELVPGEYVVTLHKGTAMAMKASLARTLGVEILAEVSEESGAILVRRPVVEKPDAAVESLMGHPLVKQAEPNWIYHANALPDDSDLEKLWGLVNRGQKVKSQDGVAGVDIDAEKAWDIQTGSSNVVVAVIDTGIDPEIPDLAPNMWVNAAERDGESGVDDDGNGFVDDVHGYDFANKDGRPVDDNGHGSHCAGTIGGYGNDGAGVVGVNWKVSLMAVKFLSRTGSGTLAAAISAIDYATKMKANIMSNSWGGGGFSEQLKAAIERAHEAGIIFIAAAGNDGANNDLSPTYPANYEVPNVVSVAAIDNRGELASFSNFGKKMVHVAAPGVDIYSTTPDGFDSYSGTSMATPHVAGVAALVLAAEPNLSVADLRDRLLTTARPLAGFRSLVASGGLVNAYNALTNTIPPPDPNDPFAWPVVDYQLSSDHPYRRNESQRFEIKVPGARRIAIYFSKFQTEARADTLTFFDGSGNQVGKWSGVHDESFSPVIEGDVAIIQFETDWSVNRYGFDITGVAYQAADETSPPSL